MSVPSTDLKHKYQGTGSQTVWPFTFKIFKKEEILVKKISGSVETILEVDIDFTVSGLSADTGGGSITYPIVGTPLPVTDYIVIKPNFNYSQELILLNQNTFPPKQTEYALDRLAMQIKQLAEQLSRALQLTDAYDGDADSFISLITSTSSQILSSLSGTSSTNLGIATGSKTFVTQSGKTWAVGQRLRAVSDDVSKIMEGEVTAYSGTSLTLSVDFTEGAGSHDDWNISFSGARGANGSGSGDMIGANNGTDFANPATTFTNLKQNATESVTGVSRFATLAETLSGIVTDAFVTPINLIAAILENNPRPLLATYTFANVGSFDIKDVFTSKYDTYDIETELTVSENNRDILMRLSPDQCVNVISGVNAYSVSGNANASGSSAMGVLSGATQSIPLNGAGLSNNVNAVFYSKVTVWNPLRASKYKILRAESEYISYTGELYHLSLSACCSTIAAYNSIRVLVGAGLFSGTIRVYGNKK